MATQRYVSTSFWDDEWIQSLDPSEKLLYLYLMTNPLTNIAGVYKITDRRISFDTGFNLDTIGHIFSKFEKSRKVYRKGEYVVLPSWPKHQKWEKSEKVKEGIVRILEELEPEIIEFLKQIGYRYPIDTLSIPNIYPSNYSYSYSDFNSNLKSVNPLTPLAGGNVPAKKQKQYLTDTEASVIINNSTTGDYASMLKAFVKNRRDIKKPMTRLALEQTLNLLATKLDTDQERIDCIQLSIANGWTGIFPERSKRDAGKSNQPSQSVLGNEDRWAAYTKSKEATRV